MLLAAIAALNYDAGYEISFSLFYLIPIAVVAQHAPRWISFLFCWVSAGALLIIDYLSGHPYSSGAAAIWNNIVNLGFFLTTAYLLNRLKIQQDLLHALATTDDLTAVFNTHGFKGQAHGYLSLADRYRHPAALARVDIVGFKALTDTKGHLEGNRALISVANTITRCGRVTDIVGRLESDEFVILLPETDYAGAQRMFGRMRDALDKNVAESGWPVSFSIGVAAYKHGLSSIDEALQHVDRIMYRVRKAGTNDILYEEQTGAHWAAYHER